MMPRAVVLTSLAFVIGCGASSEVTPSTVTASTTPARAAEPARAPVATSTVASDYKSILSIERLKLFMSDPRVVVVDVRAADEYAKGHIPGAINMPADLWRTPSQKEGKPSHDMFMRDGAIDTAKYESLLGGAGISNSSLVIVYGNHGGKADGDVPAMVLLALGHNEVGFVDGVGLERWKAAGHPVSTEPKTLPSATYRAKPPKNFVWSLADVQKNLNAKDIVIVDARSAGEYAGSDARDNKRAGHIPGAVNVDYQELLGREKTTLPPAEARKLLTQRGVTPDKRLVVYCQTATRAAHNVLVLRELGYHNVAVYDGSWQEWGNREDTPVAK